MKKDYKFLEDKAKEAIDEARKEDALIAMMVDGYQTSNECLILRDMLWYARDSGVEVRFVPNKKEEKDDKKEKK